MNKQVYKLSILIPTIVGRENMLSELVCGLIQQSGVIKSIKSYFHGSCNVLYFFFDNVEIIIASDNCSISTGMKRQVLLELANNDFIVYCDDDDKVADYFVSEILNAIQSDSDVIATNGTMLTNGQNEIKWFLSKDYPNETRTENGETFYVRTSNHLSPVKRSIAMKIRWQDKSNAEDKSWSEALNPFLKTETVIKKPIYTYLYSTLNKSYK